MKTATQQQIQLAGRRVDYRLVLSTAVRKLRIRIGPNGVDVMQPAARHGEDVTAFLYENQKWVIDQLERVDRLRSVRPPTTARAGDVLFRGTLTPVRVQREASRRRRNIVEFAEGVIVIRPSAMSPATAERSLENWMRKQARESINAHLTVVTARLGQQPQRVYLMGQRTKWGNCSALRNLSFNWRLIQGPDFVLRYIVTHEAVHLAVPDHSAKFWLTVQSLCPETERAKQWLCRHQSALTASLVVVFDQVRD